MIIQRILDIVLSAFETSVTFVYAIIVIAILWVALPIRNQIIKKSGYKYCRKCLGLGEKVCCPYCEGEGKIDWVSNVTRRST